MVPYQEKNNGRPDFKKMIYDMEYSEVEDGAQSQEQSQAVRDAFIETLKARRTRPVKTAKFKPFVEIRKQFWARPWWHIQRILIICSFAYGVEKMPSQLNWAAFVILGSYGMILFMLADIRDNIEKLCKQRKRRLSTIKTPNSSIVQEENPKKSSPELTN
jgi:hypothetical protein